MSNSMMLGDWNEVDLLLPGQDKPIRVDVHIDDESNPRDGVVDICIYPVVEGNGHATDSSHTIMVLHVDTKKEAV